MNHLPSLKKLMTAIVLLVLGLGQFVPATAQADEAADDADDQQSAGPGRCAVIEPILDRERAEREGRDAQDEGAQNRTADHAAIVGQQRNGDCTEYHPGERGTLVPPR